MIFAAILAAVFTFGLFMLGARVGAESTEKRMLDLIKQKSCQEGDTISKYQEKLKEKNAEILSFKDKAKADNEKHEEDAHVIKELRALISTNSCELSDITAQLGVACDKRCLHPEGVLENHRGVLKCPLNSSFKKVSANVGPALTSVFE